jgi:hypothetical protein
VEFAVYVVVPPEDDCGLIARCAHEAAPPEFDFSVREKGDPSESSDIQLCFRISGVSHPDEALAQALRIYELGRRAAGLRPDGTARASLTA